MYEAACDVDEIRSIVNLNPYADGFLVHVHDGNPDVGSSLL